MDTSTIKMVSRLHGSPLQLTHYYFTLRLALGSINMVSFCTRPSVSVRSTHKLYIKIDNTWLTEYYRKSILHIDLLEINQPHISVLP